MRPYRQYAPKSETSRECRYCGETFTPALMAKRIKAYGRIYIVYVRSGRMTCSEPCRAILTGQTFSKRHGIAS